MKKIIYSFLFITSLLYSYTTIYDNVPKTPSIGSKFYVHVNGIPYIFTVTSAYNYTIGTGTMDALSTTQYVSYDWKTVYIFIDTGSANGIGDQRWYYNFNYLASTDCPLGQQIDLNSNTCITPTPPPTCTDSQYLDANNVCQTIVTPSTMPPDANASHGAYTTGYATVPQSACTSSASPDFSTSLGTFHIVGWDYSVNKCIGLGFKCNSGLVYDSITQTCTAPPDTKTIPTTGDPNNPADSCVGNKWGQTWTYNFCNECQGSVGVWLPPVGLENYGLECNKKYIEYDCVSDYRLKKFTQVSCGNVLPTDKTTNTLDNSSLNTTPTIDTNISSLPSPNNTTAITNKIAKQIELQKDLNNKVSTADNQNKILDSLDKLNGKLDGINTSKLTQDGVKKGVKDALDDRDNNLSVPSDINDSGTPGGNDISAVKNTILTQYSKRYDLFGITSCGSLSVTDNTITFMQTTIENPLVIMDNSLKPYYDLFKSLFLIVGTFLGLVSVFRR